MRVAIVVLSILFSAAIIGIMLMNASETVTLKLWWDDPDHEFKDIPLGIVLFVAAFAGFLFTGIVAVLEGMKVRLDNARLERRLRRLQHELDSIRTPTLPPPPEDADLGDEETETVPG